MMGFIKGSHKLNLDPSSGAVEFKILHQMILSSIYIVRLHNVDNIYVEKYPTCL